MKQDERIDAYIKKFPDDIQEILNNVRQAISSSHSELEETMKYGIPTFVFHGNLVHFAAYKKHLGFYPDPSGINAFRDKLAGFTISKGAVQFPYSKPIPYDLIVEIVAYRINENLEKVKRG